MVPPGHCSSRWLWFSRGLGCPHLQSGLLTVGYLVAILSTIRVGEKLLQKMGARKPMLMGCAITATGILLTTFTFLLASQYMIVAFVGFTLFGIGLGFYATPSTDAALSNVPDDKAGAASGIYKMASSLGAAFGVAISAALFTALSELDTSFTAMSDLFLGRTDNVAIRFAAAVALLFNVLMVIIAIIAIIMTVPKDDRRESVSVEVSFLVKRLESALTFTGRSKCGDVLNELTAAFKEYATGTLLVLDLIGTFVFALSGAVVGVKQRLDIFGVLVLSFAAASAGGIMRDLLIGSVPPVAIRDWRYMAASVLAGLADIHLVPT